MRIIVAKYKRLIWRPEENFMINRKLLLAIMIIIGPIKLFGMQGPQQQALADMQRYHDLSHEIRVPKLNQHLAKQAKQRFHYATLALFYLGGICCAGWLNYKLAGKLFPNSSASPRGKKLKLLYSAFAGIGSGLFASCWTHFLSAQTHLFGIPNAIAHRLYPKNKREKQYLHDLYRQKLELQNTIHASQAPVDEHIRNLAERYNQLQTNVIQARANNDNTVQKIRADQDVINGELRQAKNDYAQNFEQYINRLWRSHQRGTDGQIDMQIFINGLIAYVDQIADEQQLYIRLDDHSTPTLDHALRLYLLAHNNHLIQLQQNDRLRQTFAKISRTTARLFFQYRDDNSQAAFQQLYNLASDGAYHLPNGIF